MKVIVDNALSVSEFGRRIARPDSIRYYYQVVGYSCLVLVCHDRSYPEWLNRQAVALWNFDTVDGRIINELFPGAPASWMGNPDLIQVTIRVVPHLARGPVRLFSEEVIVKLGNGC